MAFVLVLIFAVSVLLYFGQRLFYKHRNELASKLPGPLHSLPFIGDAFLFLNNDNPMKVINDLFKEHGDISRIWLGPMVLFVLMGDPRDIEVIMTSSKHTRKSSSYQFMKQWLGNGLITSEGSHWHKHRKLLTPTFHFKILEQSISSIYINSKIFVDQLKDKIGTGEFDIYHYVEKCTMDIICETAMGIKLNTQTSGDTSYMDAVKNVTEISSSRIFKIWLQPDILFRMSSVYKPYKEGVQKLQNTSNEVINRRRTQLQNNENDSQNQNNEIGKKNQVPFLDMLLLSDLNDQEINDEVQSFMFAGHDTTTTAISFSILQLALHQQIQDKVYEEIVRVIPDEHSCPSIQDLNNLKYLENVIKETMRLFPPVPMIARALDDDIALPSGYVIPKGCQININIYTVHRNETIFENPEEFIPERFDTEQVRKHPFAYIPFSGGPRNCIGQKYALLELKMILSTLVRTYRLLPTERSKNIRLSSRLILRSLDGIPVMIEYRNQ